MKDIMYVNDFMKVCLPCSIYNIDLSVLPLKSYVKDVIKYIKNNGASEYFLANRRTIDQSVIEELLIYQPDYSDEQDIYSYQDSYSYGRGIYSYMIGRLLERLPHVSGLIENTWEISELLEPDTQDILEEQLFDYHHSWILPTLNKTLYTQFQKDLYGLNFIGRNKDFEFFLPDQYEIQNVWKDVWSIENINCRISNSFARSDFLVLTIMKAN